MYRNCQQSDWPESSWESYRPTTEVYSGQISDISLATLFPLPEAMFPTVAAEGA